MPVYSILSRENANCEVCGTKANLKQKVDQDYQEASYELCGLCWNKDSHCLRCKKTYVPKRTWSSIDPIEKLCFIKHCEPCYDNIQKEHKEKHVWGSWSEQE